MQPDLAFAAQSAALRAWAVTITAEELAQPSTLAGWTIAELLGHLVQVHDSVAALRPAQNDAEPMAISDYLAGYQGATQTIAESARSIARNADNALLDAWDATAAQAAQTLGALGAADRVVQSRRGPILASDFLRTRVIELVVHAADLRRSLPAGHPAPPVLPSAEHQVVQVLREVLTARAADPVQALAAASQLDPAEFADVATGRAALPPELASALGEVLPLM